MREVGRSLIFEMLETLISSLVLSVPFSYFAARFYLRLQEPIEAFFVMAALTFLLGFIRKQGTLSYYFYRSILTFILTMVFTSAISAFVIIYPYTGSVYIYKIYPALFIRILEYVPIHIFFSMGVGFMLLGSLFSPELKEI